MSSGPNGSAANVLSIAVPTPVKEAYGRNSKRGGVKHLRCFPDCGGPGGTHKKKGFCGQSIVVEVRCRPRAPEALDLVRVVGLFSPVSDAPTLRVGDTIGVAMAENCLLKTDQDRMRPWYRGKLVSTEALGQLGAESMLEFSLNWERRGWHYGWVGNKSRTGTRHVLRVHVLELDRVGGENLRCIGSTTTSEFALDLQQRRRKGKRKLIPAVVPPRPAPAPLPFAARPLPDVPPPPGSPGDEGSPGSSPSASNGFLSSTDEYGTDEYGSASDAGTSTADTDAAMNLPGGKKGKWKSKGKGKGKGNTAMETVDEVGLERQSSTEFALKFNLSPEAEEQALMRLDSGFNWTFEQMNHEESTSANEHEQRDPYLVTSNVNGPSVKRRRQKSPGMEVTEGVFDGGATMQDVSHLCYTESGELDSVDLALVDEVFRDKEVAGAAWAAEEKKNNKRSGVGAFLMSLVPTFGFGAGAGEKGEGKEKEKRLSAGSGPTQLPNAKRNPLRAPAGATAAANGEEALRLQGPRAGGGARAAAVAPPRSATTPQPQRAAVAPPALGGRGASAGAAAARGGGGRAGVELAKVVAASAPPRSPEERVARFQVETPAATPATPGDHFAVAVEAHWAGDGGVVGATAVPPRSLFKRYWHAHLWFRVLVIALLLAVVGGVAYVVVHTVHKKQADSGDEGDENGFGAICANEDRLPRSPSNGVEWLSTICKNKCFSRLIAACPGGHPLTVYRTHFSRKGSQIRPGGGENGTCVRCPGPPKPFPGIGCQEEEGETLEKTTKAWRRLCRETGLLFVPRKSVPCFGADGGPVDCTSREKIEGVPAMTGTQFPTSQPPPSAVPSARPSPAPQTKVPTLPITKEPSLRPSTARPSSVLSAPCNERHRPTHQLVRDKEICPLEEKENPRLFFLTSKHYNSEDACSKQCRENPNCKVFSLVKGKACIGCGNLKFMLSVKDGDSYRICPGADAPTTALPPTDRPSPRPTSRKKPVPRPTPNPVPNPTPKPTPAPRPTSKPRPPVGAPTKRPCPVCPTLKEGKCCNFPARCKGSCAGRGGGGGTGGTGTGGG